jgi:thiosulfate/3-mercaptopyruvate sulfurtransferase
MTSNHEPRHSNTVGVEQLASTLQNDEGLVLLDVRFTPGKPGRKDSYLAEHLPGARYIDLPTELADPIARQNGQGNNPLPDIAKLQEDLRRLGVSASSSIVVYDDTNGAPAARAWWTLRWAGVEGVRVLDGGLSAWKAARHRLDQGDAGVATSGDIQLRSGVLPRLTVDQVTLFPARGMLVDVRPASSYRGEGSGHIPKARSFPADRLVGPGGKLVAEDELKQRLKDAGIDLSLPLAAYCNGGIASTLFTLALAGIGKEVTLYPGSWSEWSADPSRPVEA